jgi:hypothetical protein
MSPSPVNLGSFLRYPSAGRSLRSYGKTRGAYLAAIITSILVMGGLATSIGILCGGELGQEGARKEDTGDELLRGVGNNRGFREKASELKSADVSLHAGVVTVTRGGAVKTGVGKSSVVLGLR